MRTLPFIKHSLLLALVIFTLPCTLLGEIYFKKMTSNGCTTNGAKEVPENYVIYSDGKVIGAVHVEPSRLNSEILFIASAANLASKRKPGTFFVIHHGANPETAAEVMQYAPEGTQFIVSGSCGYVVPGKNTPLDAVTISKLRPNVLVEGTAEGYVTQLGDDGTLYRSKDQKGGYSPNGITWALNGRELGRYARGLKVIPTTRVTGTGIAQGCSCSSLQNIRNILSNAAVRNGPRIPNAADRTLAYGSVVAEMAGHATNAVQGLVRYIDPDDTVGSRFVENAQNGAKLTAATAIGGAGIIAILGTGASLLNPITLCVGTAAAAYTAGYSIGTVVWGALLDQTPGQTSEGMASVISNERINRINTLREHGITGDWSGMTNAQIAQVWHNFLDTIGQEGREALTQGKKASIKILPPDCPPNVPTCPRTAINPS